MNMGTRRQRTSEMRLLQLSHFKRNMSIALMALLVFLLSFVGWHIHRKARLRCTLEQLEELQENDFAVAVRDLLASHPAWVCTSTLCVRADVVSRLFGLYIGSNNLNSMESDKISTVSWTERVSPAYPVAIILLDTGLRREAVALLQMLREYDPDGTLDMKLYEKWKTWEQRDREDMSYAVFDIVSRSAPSQMADVLVAETQGAFPAYAWDFLTRFPPDLVPVDPATILRSGDLRQCYWAGRTFRKWGRDSDLHWARILLTEAARDPSLTKNCRIELDKLPALPIDSSALGDGLRTKNLSDIP